MLFRARLMTSEDCAASSRRWLMAIDTICIILTGAKCAL
jgi:hypothetical protein